MTDTIRQNIENSLVERDGAGFPVSVGELRAAITQEIRGLEFRSATIRHQRRRISSRPHAPQQHNPSGKKSSALTPDGAAKAKAMRNYSRAKQQLNKVASDIEIHNKETAAQNIILSIIFFVSNHNRANELLQSRARAMRRYDRAKADLDAIGVTFRRQARIGQGESAETAGGGGQVSMLEERKLSILQSFLVSELAVRKELQSLLVGVPNQVTISVNSQNLDTAIRDPQLRHRIVSLKEQNRARLRHSG